MFCYFWARRSSDEAYTSAYQSRRDPAMHELDEMGEVEIMEDEPIDSIDWYPSFTAAGCGWYNVIHFVRIYSICRYIIIYIYMYVYMYIYTYIYTHV